MTYSPWLYRQLHTLLLAVLVACTAGCATRPAVDPTETVTTAAPLILISLDGVHPNYLKRGVTPNLERLMREGAHAAWMTPSYPSLTFPNHYTIVTGLRPDKHGIVNNTMYDPQLGWFARSSKATSDDTRWWGGEPLWVTVQKSGQRSATMFWPGSEAEIGGVRPWQWSKFNNEVSIDARVDRVLGWLDLPVGERPRFISLYFEHADKAGHDHGPDSAELDAALRQIDAGIARLLAGLESRALSNAVNIVVVSDHGMAKAEFAKVAAIEMLVSKDVADVITMGQTLGFAPRPGREREAEAALLKVHPHLQCWRKSELPARWRYGAHARVPAIVCQAEEGWSFLGNERIERWRKAGGHDKGEHGYDSQSQSMRAIFIAHGPAFRSDVVLPPIESVDVYPLLARLCGVEAKPNDGDPRVMLKVLKSR